LIYEVEIGMGAYKICIQAQIIISKNTARSPPGWFFGLVWTILYILITLSFGKVFILAGPLKLLFIIALPFILNLMFIFPSHPCSSD